MLDASSQNSPRPDQSPSELDHSPLPPRFALGRVVSTPGALLRLIESDSDAFGIIQRHSRGDWGDLTPDDAEDNNAALIEGTRLLSAYELPDGGGRVWVITEADRSVTTLLLPEEY